MGSTGVRFARVKLGVAPFPPRLPSCCMQVDPKAVISMVRILIAISLMVCTAAAEPINVDEIVVKDGDTIALHGITYRMVGYDTPEAYTRRRSVGPNERALAEIATLRFKELLKSGHLDLTEVPCSCHKRKI